VARPTRNQTDPFSGLRKEYHTRRRIAWRPTKGQRAGGVAVPGTGMRGDDVNV
jgi:hypothetical protein